MENITVPRWFLEVVEDTLRIQNNINLELEKGTGETCQDRNVKQSLNGIRKLLKGEELTGMERLEKLQPSLPSNLDEAAERCRWKIEEHCAIDDRGDSIYSECDIEEAFKAGVEWMFNKLSKKNNMDENPCGTLSQIEEAAIQAHIRLEESGEGLSFLNIFKAGAEWMASQGYIKEGIALPDDCEIWVNFTDTDIKDGDEVIVQIRKK